MTENPSSLFDGLLPWQHGSVCQYWNAFQRHGVAVNASEMGLGKTYMTGAVLREAAPGSVLVVCPLAVIPTWERVLGDFGVGAQVLNYEKAKLPRFGLGDWVEFDRGGRAFKRWEWRGDVETIVFDEVHRCGGESTENSKLLRAAKREGKRILMLSGTLAESPLQMKALGYALELYGKNAVSKDFRSFLYCHGVVPTNYGLKFTGRGYPGGSADERQEAVMRKLHARIFPEWGTRLRIADVGADYPETVVSSELYQTDNGEEIQRLYDEMAEAVDVWKRRSMIDRNPDHPLTKRLRERQLIELLKVGIFEDLTRDSLASGHRVAIFVNFIPTLSELAKRFPDFEVFYGDCTETERREALSRFQGNQSPGIILQIDSGGTGIDLHDLDGRFPRDVYVSPGYSIKALRQALKRTHRAGARSVSTQRIVLVKGTVEEDVFKALRRKGDNLDALHDHDLLPENLRLDNSAEIH